MKLAHFKTDIDKDGIATFLWDMADRSMNIITQTVMDELEAIIEYVADTDKIKSAVITSGKNGSFTGGADITMLHALLDNFEKEKIKDTETALNALFENSSRLSRIYRQLETCGKPFVVAINGICMGGGTELALAAHGRVMLDHHRSRLGLPEVKIGIFPGAGGTQRVMRMANPQAGLQFLLQGRSLNAQKAKAIGLIDEVVTKEADLIPAAKTMLKQGLSAEKPWDKQGFRPEGAARIYSKAGFQLWAAANALYRKETHNNYPGARAILNACYEGLLLPMDQALMVESRHFANVLQTKQAAHMLRSLFVSNQALSKSARRPQSIPASALRKIGIVGAGFMGAGIAFVSAKAGLQVVLLDQTDKAAEKGKAYSAEQMDKAIQRGLAEQETKQNLLSLITATSDYSTLQECDLVIEAVFEDRAVKANAISAIDAVVGKTITVASNTSTLPITSLAKNQSHENRFIGIHFFSPVEKMPLVEVIRGEKTDDQALAVALDYVRAIRKTPIVVQDARGFYANRCVMAYLLEAHLMLSEGIPAVMIENLARQAGMPVGPLALNDEVALDLGWKILQATKKDLGAKAIHPAQEKLLHDMVITHKRLGRKNGKGFYDYDGRNKKIWKGLPDIVPQLSNTDEIDAIDTKTIKNRFLAIQALEAARCLEEGVVTDVREADVGSILGFGFAPFTGGTLSYIDGMGTTTFVNLCHQLAKTYGPRFKPNALLKDLAQKQETFYNRFDPEQTAA